MSNIIDKIQVSGVTYDIQGSGGGGITVDPTLDSGSTNPVANSAITTALDAKVNVADNVVNFYEILSESQSGGYIYPKNVDGNHCKKWYYTTSGISTTTTYEVQNYITPTTGGSGSFSLIIQLAIDNGVITGYTVTQDTFNALDSASVTNGVMEVKLKDDYYVEIINLQSNNGLYTYNPIYTIKENQSADALNEDIKGILESYWNNIGSSLKQASFSYDSYSKGNYILLNTRSNNNGTQGTYFQLADGVNMKYVYDGNSGNNINGKLIPIITSNVPSWNSINYNSTNTGRRYLPSDYTTTTGNKSQQVTSVRAYVNTATTLSSGSERSVIVYIQSWSGDTAVTTNSLTYNYTTENTFTANSTTTRTEEASGITHTYSGNVLTVTSTNPDVLIRYIRARVTSPDRAVDNSTDLLTDAEIQTPIKTGQEAYNELDERINALTGGSSCTVQEKLLFENYYRINYGDNQTKVYFTYSGTPTDSSVFYSFNISGTSVDQYANGSVNFGTGGHTANTTGWDTYYSVTWDSANTRFLFATNEGYYIHSMSRPDSHVYFQIPIGTVSGTPCDAVSTLTDGLNAVSSKAQNSLKNAFLTSDSRKFGLYAEKNNGDNTQFNINLKDLKFASDNVLETDINVGLGTSGWTTLETSDNCSASDLDITKFKAIYGDGITSYTQKALYVNYQFTYNGGSFGDSFRTDFSDDTTVTANTPTTGWSVLYDSVTSAMTVTAPEGEVEYQGSVGTFNIIRIDNNNCKFNNGITLQKYGENTTPIRQYVQENRAALGGLSLVKLTQAQYDALATKDSNTLYVING